MRVSLLNPDSASQIERKLEHLRREAELERLLKSTQPVNRWRDTLARGLIRAARRLSPERADDATATPARKP